MIYVLYNYIKRFTRKYSAVISIPFFVRSEKFVACLRDWDGINYCAQDIVMSLESRGSSGFSKFF